MAATPNTTLRPFDDNIYILFRVHLLHQHLEVSSLCNSGSNRRELSPSCDFLPKSISGIGKMIDFDGGLNFKDNIAHAHSIPILGVGKERRKKNGPWLYLKRHHPLVGLN